MSGEVEGLEEGGVGGECGGEREIGFDVAGGWCADGREGEVEGLVEEGGGGGGWHFFVSRGVVVVFVVSICFCFFGEELRVLVCC